ncbi:MAG TPA: hypothetical protein PK413_15050, partial [Thermoanaerobaculia bacterium]|nr:hypothetical protein [Thermoanaerobaculia bacterium]
MIGQALRLAPLELPGLVVATRAGERILPAAVPSWLPPPALPSDLAARLAFLAARSVDWPGAPPTEGGCELFLRVSAQHWARRPTSPAELVRWGAAVGGSATYRRVYLRAADFLDDDDRDGDLLDPGELGPGPEGAEAEVFCGPLAAAEGGP